MPKTIIVGRNTLDVISAAGEPYSSVLEARDFVEHVKLKNICVFAFYRLDDIFVEHSETRRYYGFSSHIYIFHAIERADAAVTFDF